MLPISSKRIGEDEDYLIIVHPDELGDFRPPIPEPTSAEQAIRRRGSCPTLFQSLQRYPTTLSFSPFCYALRRISSQSCANDAGELQRPK